MKQARRKYEMDPLSEEELRLRFERMVELWNARADRWAAEKSAIMDLVSWLRGETSTDPTSDLKKQWATLVQRMQFRRP